MQKTSQYDREQFINEWNKIFMSVRGSGRTYGEMIRVIASRLSFPALLFWKDQPNLSDGVVAKKELAKRTPLGKVLFDL